VLTVTHDAVTSQLRYALSHDGPGGDRLMAVWIHSGTVEKPGAARHQLFTAGGPASGIVTLSAADRRDLAAGHLLVRFFVKSGNGSAADVPLVFPG
jgi:hypothetical protein